MEQVSTWTAPPHGEAGLRDGDGARLEIPDQPGLGALGAGRRRRRRLNDQRCAAQPRHRPDDRRAGYVGPAGRWVSSRAQVSGKISPAADARIDCGLAGTVLRFVPPLAALSVGTVTFDGDEQARVRPIAPLLDALRGLGVDVDGDGLPFRVAGTGSVAGGAVEIDASASSQFVSGLLLSGASFTEGLIVQHVGPTLPSAPHIAMTVAMLRQAGVDVDDATPDRWQVRPGVVAARHWDIEPDLSNAVPFIAAAVVSAGSVRITGWPAASIQPAEAILSILRQLNSVVRQSDSYLEVQGPQSYQGFDVTCVTSASSPRRWRCSPRWPPRARCRG